MQEDSQDTDRVPGRLFHALGIALIAAMILGVAGRLLAMPLGRDENLYIAAGSGLDHFDLYRDLGYNHLPNLAYLLHGAQFLSGGAYPLLMGRFVVLGFWMCAVVAIWLVGRQLGADRLARVTVMVVLMGNVLLLGPPGMLVTNNFAPVPMVMFAFYFLLRAVNGERPSSLGAFLSGVFVSLAIGLKANYVFLAPAFAAAGLLAPAERSLAFRMRHLLLPLAAGGVLGGLPTILHFMAGPEAMVAHTVDYFTELQTAYWAQNPEPQASSLASRVLLAEQIWFADGNLLAFTGIAILLLMPLLDRGAGAGLRQLWHWPLVLCLSLVVLGMVVAFVPKPSFPQYFVPPVPFMLLSLLVLCAGLGARERNTARPILLAITCLAVIGSASRILPGMVALLQPQAWPGVAIHREARELAAQAHIGGTDKVATLSPLLALEAGTSIYPEFAAGQFVFRVADLIPPDQRPFYRTTSARELTGFLDAQRPTAIMIDPHEPMEARFAEYAGMRNYREIRLPGGERARHMRLFVRPN